MRYALLPNDFDSNADQTCRDIANTTESRFGKIHNAAFDERPTIIDFYNDAFSVRDVRNSYSAAKRNRFVRCSFQIVIVWLTAGRLFGLMFVGIERGFA